VGGGDITDSSVAMIATLLRATVLCAASFITDNSPLDSVVFRSSLQIMLGVVYVLLFHVAATVVRVLTNRRALSDPTDLDVDYDSPSGWQTPVTTPRGTSELQSGSLRPHTTQRHRLAEVTGGSQPGTSGFVVRGNKSLISKIGRGVGRVRVLVQRAALGPRGQTRTKTDERDSFHIRKRSVVSVDDPFSDLSDSSGHSVDSGAGVYQKKCPDPAPRRIDSSQRTVVDLRVEGAPVGYGQQSKPVNNSSQSGRLSSLAEADPDDLAVCSQDVSSANLSTRTGLPVDHKKVPSLAAQCGSPQSADSLDHSNSPLSVSQPSLCSPLGGMPKTMGVNEPSGRVGSLERRSERKGLVHGDQHYSISVPWHYEPQREAYTNSGRTAVVVSEYIYTDVYGLGFSAFVLHYCMDCASLQPTVCMLIGLTLLGFRDIWVISESVAVEDLSIPQVKLFTRALTLFAFVNLIAGQVCMVVAIVLVPTYYTHARGGGITMIPSPDTILEGLLAWVLPLLAPVSLYLVGRRGSNHDVPKTLRRALPTTVLISLWFITCFGAMSDQVRSALGALSVNTTLTELSNTDVAVNMQIPLLMLAPLIKIPALLAVVSCCLTKKTMDIVSTLCVCFCAKQLSTVRDLEIIKMLTVALIFSCAAWCSCTIRYCDPVMYGIARFFERNRGEPAGSP
jgi:hypothetical protein